MSLPAFSVRNHVLVNMMMLVILVGGGLFAFTLVREMFPESRPDKLLISAIYPGVQPEEVEKAVTIKIEEAVRDVTGVEKVDSTVAEGRSVTVVTLYNEVKNVDAVLQEIKNELDAIQNLPRELEKLTVRKLEPRLPVIAVAVYGDGDEAALKRAARGLRDDLLLLPGISDVEISGSRDDEIHVEVRPERLLEYDISFDQVAQAIHETNLDVSGGELKGSRTTISVRTLGEELRGVGLEEIVVRSERDGREVRLRDVAVVRDDFIESDLESLFNGKPAVSCVVYKTGAQDVVQIARLVKAYVAGKQGLRFDPHGLDEAYAAAWSSKPFLLAGAWLARGIEAGAARITGRPDPQAHYQQSLARPFDHNFEVALHTDLARFVEGRLELLTRNGKAGLFLVVLSLVLFLNHRVAFWAAVGLPVSFLGTFVVMWAFGATINLLSMFGLIIVLGIIVDDAIVIGENIYRHIEEGMPPREAAVKGAEEVMWPVSVAVLTTIAAFAPLLFIKGQIGDFLGQLPIVVLAALTVSLVEALVILPAHLANLPSRKSREQRAAEAEQHGSLARWLLRFRTRQERLVHGTLTRLYEGFLRRALAWRYVTLAVALALLMVAWGMYKGGIVEETFIQKMDSEMLICKLEMPVGTPAGQVKERLAMLSELAVEAPEVINVQMFVALHIDVGGTGATGVNNQSHLGQLMIELKAADQREREGGRSSQELLTGFREVSERLAGVNAVTWESMDGGPAGKDIHVRIAGRDFDELVVVAEKLKQELRGYRGVYDIADDFEQGKREVQLRLRESARPTGITVDLLGQHVRSAMYGRESKRLTRDREDVRIMVRYPEDFRSSLYNLESMWVPTASLAGPRGWVPLGEVAELTEAASYSSIQRSQQQRAISVFGEVDDEQTKTWEVLAQIRQTFDARIAPEHPQVQIEFLGSHEEMKKAFGSLKVAFPVALLLIYMMLAGLFRSYLQPVVVMSAIPFGLLGAVFGHWVTGQPMTFLSWIGLVALTGILVNDSLVLVDFINRRVRRGMDYFEASVEGARLRLRPILLTTLTTVAGLTPLMFERSFQAAFLIPMAVTLTFGLVFATALTLVIVPVLNLIFFDLNCVGRTSRSVQR